MLFAYIQYALWYFQFPAELNAAFVSCSGADRAQGTRGPEGDGDGAVYTGHGLHRGRLPAL